MTPEQEQILFDQLRQICERLGITDKPVKRRTKKDRKEGMKNEFRIAKQLR